MKTDAHLHTGAVLPGSAATQHGVATRGPRVMHLAPRILSRRLGRSSSWLKESFSLSSTQPQRLTEVPTLLLLEASQSLRVLRGSTESGAETGGCRGVKRTETLSTLNAHFQC